MTTITPFTDAANRALDEFTSETEKIVAAGSVHEVEADMVVDFVSCAMLSTADCMDKELPPDWIANALGRAVANAIMTSLDSLASASGVPKQALMNICFTECIESVHQLDGHSERSSDEYTRVVVETAVDKPGAGRA